MILLDVLFFWWKWWKFEWSNACGEFYHFFTILNIESHHSNQRGILTTSPIWYGDGGFYGIIISLFSSSWMCLIWFNMDRFYQIFVIKILFSLCDAMTWIFLNLTVIYWAETVSMTCCADVVTFHTIIIIHALVLSLACDDWFHGVLFFGCET